MPKHDFDFEPMVKPLSKKKKNKVFLAEPSEKSTQPFQSLSMANPHAEVTEKTVLKRKKTYKNENVKKQIRIPLPNGASLKLPAVVLPKIDFRVLSAVIFLGCGLVLYLMIFGETFRISTVETDEIVRISVEEINEAVALKGTSIFMLNPKDIELDLALVYNELTDISVDVEFPAQVTVTGKERIPLIHLTVQNANADVWIDEDGISFDVRDGIFELVEVVSEEFLPMVRSANHLEFEAESKEYRIAQNLQSHHLMTTDMVKAVLMMNAVLPENTVLIFDVEKGLGWRDHEKGWLVYFGFSMERVDEKLLVYDAIAKELSDFHIEPYLISVEHLQAPYYRLEQ